MAVLELPRNHPRRNVRLDTLVRLRWLAVIGQTTAVLVVYFGFDFDLPIWSCLGVMKIRYRPTVCVGSTSSAFVELCGRNVSETARRLNIHRRTLQRILAMRAPR